MPQAIYPGTFDPVTRGHVDIIERAAKLFDALEVAVAADSSKTPLLALEERLELARRAVEPLKNVSVRSFEGLLVHYARKQGANILVRGLRQASDFTHEYQLAVANRKLHPDLETVCLMSASEYGYISSTIVREVYRHGGDLSPFVPDAVCTLLEQKRRTGSIHH